MFAVTAAEFTAEGTANILVNAKFIPLWGCPRTILSDNGLQFCSKLSQAVSQLLGVRKLARTSYHPHGYGGVQRVNHTLAQMLAMIYQDNMFPRTQRTTFWIRHRLYSKFAYSRVVLVSIQKKGLLLITVYLAKELLG